MAAPKSPPSIDTNVPAPGGLNPYARKGYTFTAGRLGVNESFLIPDGNTKTVSNQMLQWRKKFGYRYTQRKVDGGVRVWRIS